MSIENNELIMSALDKIVKIRQKPGNDKIISEVLPDFLNLVFKRFLMPVRCQQ